MNPNKREAVEFCMNKYVTNKMTDIWLTIILTLGLALLIFPILIWLIYRYIKEKKRIAILKDQIYNDPSFLDKVHAAETFNSIVVDINGTSLEIPQLYFWLSKYSKKELVELLNN
jgi:TM2 domain-containing membrane protein YozV